MPKGQKLSPKQKARILQALAYGNTYREVADQFNISIKSIERIVAEKLNGSS